MKQISLWVFYNDNDILGEIRLSEKRVIWETLIVNFPYLLLTVLLQVFNI